MIKLKKASESNRATPVPQHNFSSSADDYELLGEIGTGATATVYIAMYKPTGQTVAVKIVNLEGYGTNIKEVQNEISVMIQCSHPNVVQYYSSFVEDMELWLVMRLLDGGSVLDVLKLSDQKGLEEAIIATILKETLKALIYFHSNGHIHRDVKAGNILIDTDGTVQLADFGVSSCWSNPNEDRKTFAGTPCWMAPEVMEQTTGYNQKADIWSFGITAIELATGHAPHSHLSAMRVMLAVLNSPSPSLDLGKYPQYTKQLKRVIDACVQKDPTKRPTAAQLMQMDFFKKAKSPEYIATNLLANIVPLSVRIRRDRPQVKSGECKNDVDETIDEWNYDENEVSNDRHQKEVVVVGDGSSGFVNNKDDNDDSAAVIMPKGSYGSVAGSSSVDEDTEYEGSGEEIKLKLRMRNAENKLNDIRFPFDLIQDTPELVCHELVVHGLVPSDDEESICKSIQQFLESKEPIHFSVKMISNVNSKTGEPVVPDKNALLGYALLSLDENQE